MITGAGIDLFDVARIEREVARHGVDLLDDLFTGAEQAACSGTRRPSLGYAARFAAKEACFKALGTGMVGRMTWHDVEVTTAPDGTATISLGGDTARVAAEQGVNQVLVSIALTPGHAVAWVVLGDADGL